MSSTGAQGSDDGASGFHDHPSVDVVVPPELALDELSRNRLIDRLVASPTEVTAVAAPLEHIDPGSSTTVQAEWAAVTAAERSLRPVPSPDQIVTAAVAVRAGVDHTVDRRSVTVARGTILMDPSTRTSDPFDRSAPIEPAGPMARPPFRRRPMVLFLEGNEPLADPEALRDLVNGLVVHEVEARLATDQSIDGPHLTRICSPTEATWRALQPDVAVLGDPAAVERATSWCDQRGTVFVELDPALGSAVELVSWTIGQAQGRLRARIGPVADPAEVARLVNRLCSGPQPEPPVDPAGSPVAAPRRGRAPRGTIHRVAITVGAGTSPRARAWLDQLDAAGHPGQTVDLRTDQPATDGHEATVLIVDPATDPADLASWLARAGTGSRAVVDLSSRSLDAPEAVTLALARAAGAVLVDRPERADAWRAQGVRAQVAPVLLTPARTEGLRAAAARRLDPAAPLLGWQLQPLDDRSADAERRSEGRVRQAIVAALIRFLDDQPEARIEIVGVPPADLSTDHPQIVRRSSPPDPGELAAWTAQIWSPTVPAMAGVEVFEAAFAGVPVVSAARVEGTDGELTITSPEDASAWLATLQSLTDDDARRRWSTRAAHRAEALRGPEGSGAAVERFLGWARVGADR